MEITYRLDILKEAGQISEANYDKIIEIINHFNENHLIEINEENGAMLITHLCIALNRMDKEEKINGIEDELYADVQKNKYYDKSERTLTEIEQILGREMPIEEKGYMIMHLCVLFEKVGQKINGKEEKE